MDGTSGQQPRSLPSLVIHNITNIDELKDVLEHIIFLGKEYEKDVSSCIKVLMCHKNPEIVMLSCQAIAELVKSEEHRAIYSQIEIIQPLLKLLQLELNQENIPILKQCCRALGNLCCDCDEARKIILECDGLPLLIDLLKRSSNTQLKETAPELLELNSQFKDIKMFSSKTLLNYCIGGKQFSDVVIKEGLLEVINKILDQELANDDMDDDMVSTSLLILSVINDNSSENVYEEGINVNVLKILKVTTNIDISELCLDHLHAQAEHDSVKNLLANEGGVQTVCTRLEQLTKRHEAGDLTADDVDVIALMKQACDLIIIVLTGDDAMHTLYQNGVGEVYITMVRWLNSTNYHLLTTAVLAIGNFARQDDYCAQMMDDKIFDKLLDIFETYHGFAMNMIKEPDIPHPIKPSVLTKIQHAVLSALRNLTVPVANKRVAAAQGRAAPIFLSALPHVENHHVAYKLLAAVRMLVDGQEGVAKQLAVDHNALASVAKWGHAGEYAGAAGEAPRLLAWTVKQLRHQPHWTNIVQVEGCISSLVNMLVASHAVMQNEAILALTLLAIQCLKPISPDAEPPTYDYEKNFITQLIKSEIGNHVSVLVDTNYSKMPKEVAENLLAFLDITLKKNAIAADYKDAKVPESLRKFSDLRRDFSDDLKACIAGVVSAITDIGKND